MLVSREFHSLTQTQFSELTVIAYVYIYRFYVSNKCVIFSFPTGKKEFNFLPLTYILPQEIKQLKRDWDEGKGKAKWIVKPVGQRTNTATVSLTGTNWVSRKDYRYDWLDIW